LGGEAMRLRNVVFMTVVLVFILTSPALSQQWVDVKDPKDLKALHSNKTFKYTVMQVPCVEHYRADGKGIRIAGEQREPLTWEVKGDQVCVPYMNATVCWQFQRSKKNPDEYVRREPKRGWMEIIKVEDGIPEF
jgi:hypothetical protein